MFDEYGNPVAGTPAAKAAAEEWDRENSPAALQATLDALEDLVYGETR